MLVGILTAGLVAGVLISSIVSLLISGRTLLIFGGDVIACDEYGITFDNVEIEGDYNGLNASNKMTLDILSQWQAGDTYTLDLGWFYNTHVFTGERYGVSAYYRDGQFEDVTVTAHVHT
jgi:hypothetical protein